MLMMDDEMDTSLGILVYSNFQYKPEQKDVRRKFKI